MSEQVNSYDEIPYPKLSFIRTHPVRTAALAGLFGIKASDPARSRVLELGCAAGANLLPMAAEYPSAEFVGIDLSAKQVAVGEAARLAAGIENAEIRHGDIASIDDTWGQFDFIIAHGLYSWVPESVQDEILRICRERLSPNGVAYVSYNVLPGWHFRRTVRDMMLYHVTEIPDPRVRIQQARLLLDFIATNGAAGPYAEMLKREAELLKKEPDGYLFHEFLERDNNPVYFSTFMTSVKKAGLEYLSDASLASMDTGNLTKEVEGVLGQLSGGRLSRNEQYLDFLRNRTFRESLLVRDDAQLTRKLKWEPISSFWITASSSLDDVAEGSTVVFKSPVGHTIQLKEPFAIAAMYVLKESANKQYAFSELLAKVRSRTQSRESESHDQAELCKFLLEAYRLLLVTFEASPWPKTQTVTDAPRTSALVRYQAQSGGEVVSLDHRTLDGMSADYRHLISLMDGNHTLSQLVDSMMSLIDPARLPDDIKVIAKDPVKFRQVAEERVRAILEDMNRLGLLAE